MTDNPELRKLPPGISLNDATEPGSGFEGFDPDDSPDSRRPRRGGAMTDHDDRLPGERMDRVRIVGYDEPIMIGGVRYIPANVTDELVDRMLLIHEEIDATADPEARSVIEARAKMRVSLEVLHNVRKET